MAFNHLKLLSTELPSPPSPPLHPLKSRRFPYSFHFERGGYGQLVTLCYNNKQYFNYRNWIMSWRGEGRRGATRVEPERDVLELKIGTLWPHFTTCSLVNSQNKYNSNFLSSAA